MKVIWLRQAVRSRERQIDYIAENNPLAAARIEQAIVDAAKLLSEHPRMGRLGRLRGTRELVVARTSFIVVYVIEADAVRIIRVLHTAQRWPSPH